MANPENGPDSINKPNDILRLTLRGSLGKENQKKFAQIVKGAPVEPPFYMVESDTKKRKPKLTAWADSKTVELTLPGRLSDLWYRAQDAINRRRGKHKQSGKKP